MTEQTMTPAEVLAVLALVNAASPGPWEPDDMESDGVYGDGGPDGRAGFMAQRMRDANGVSIFDSLNSEGAMVDEDIGEESVYAWDVVAQKNFEAIAAAMNFFRKHGTAVAALIARNAELEAESVKLRNIADAGIRAIGDHFAPNDCYSTGPLTGDPYLDLVECPACAFIAMHDEMKARAEAGHG